VLKEVRIERNIHQAQVAEVCGKTPSAWTKIETGRNPLSMDIFYKVCTALSVSFSSVLSTTERYAALIGQSGWGVLTSPLPFDEDVLLNEASNYYSSPGFRNKAQNNGWGFGSVLNGPIYNTDGSITLMEVFRFVLDEEFKKLSLSEHHI